MNDANPGGDFEQDGDQDDDADYEGAHRQNNIARDVEEDSGALPNADYDTRTSPSRRRHVTAEDVADLEHRRDRIWWDVDLLETKKMRMEMEMEDLEAALARADSSLQATSRKHQQVEEDMNNKVRRKEEVEREIAEKEQFWERYLRTLKVQVDGQKQCLNFLTKEVEQARRQSANIPRFSTASGHLNIEDSDFATEPVDADRYNSLLIHARQGYLDPHVEVNRSNHESAHGECSSRPGLFDGLLAAVQEAMESPSEEENSLGSLLAAIEQEAERHNSPPRQSQEVPVHTDVLQSERIPQTFSCADQQLPMDSEDPRPERIPPEVSSQENDPPATSNANSPGNPQPPSVGIEEGNETTRKEKRKAATAALVEPSSPSKRVATVSPATSNNIPRFAFATFFNNAAPTSHLCESRNGSWTTLGSRPTFTSTLCYESWNGSWTAIGRGRPPLPPAAAESRNALGSRPTSTSTRSSESRNARQGDDDIDIWADFAEYQAQAAANSETKKWEAWLREAFMTETERAERMLRIIAEDKAQWDAIVATFPYGARNQFDNRVGYDPSRFCADTEGSPRATPTANSASCSNRAHPSRIRRRNPRSQLRISADM
ncbi:hypothetical protein R1sor_011760 [Riccia sorocarpa]|uniref:Uncharacterized protein n=1 Tax=Riccia sorocarpa TaxID=122646 RepID=A0ABD3I7Y6_9MARC